MDDNNNVENNTDENVSLFDMYGVDQPIKHNEPKIAPVIKEENEVFEEETTSTQEQITNNEQDSSSDEVINNNIQEDNANEDNKEINSISDIDNNSNESTNNSDSQDDELIRTFVGPAYDKFVNGKFNIGAFFFTSAYFFYRKMTVYGIIYAIFNLIAPAIIRLPVRIAAGFLANKMYLDYAKDQVEMIKESTQGGSDLQVTSMLKDSGGTSIAFAIGMLIVISIISAAISTMLTTLSNS